MGKIKIGVIGLGQRGYQLIDEVITKQERYEIVSVCDVYQDRVEKTVNLIKERLGYEPIGTDDYKEVIDNENVKAVLISSSWETHVDFACYAMKKGKIVALEVGGAYDVHDCWKLVDTYEETQTPIMFMENCCFDRRELMALNMANKGLLGEIVHCMGGYWHDLRDEISYGLENRHYRFRNYQHRCSHNYPTHDLGPIAKVIDINAGNRLVSLTSTASKACGLKDFIKRNRPDDEYLNSVDFKQGDIITTVIKAMNGESIVLCLDTSLIHNGYNRNFSIRGTHGWVDEITNTAGIFTEDGKRVKYDFKNKTPEENEEIAKEWAHPAWDNLDKANAKDTHGGCDTIEFKVFADCVEQGKPFPIDVYDAATWMSITALSEASIINGSNSVVIPDFTRGKWIHRENLLKKMTDEIF